MSLQCSASVYASVMLEKTTAKADVEKGRSGIGEESAGPVQKESNDLDLDGSNILFPSNLQSDNDVNSTFSNLVSLDNGSSEPSKLPSFQFQALLACPDTLEKVSAVGNSAIGLRRYYISRTDSQMYLTVASWILSFDHVSKNPLARRP